MSALTNFMTLSRYASHRDLWGRNGWTRKHRFAAMTAGFVGLRIDEDQFVVELSRLFEEGCDRQLAEDTIRQMAAYVGYIHAAKAMSALDRVVARGGVAAEAAPISPEPSDEERYARGIEDYNKLNPAALGTIRTAFDDLAPDLANLTFRAFGDVYAASRQDLATRQIATVAGLGCMGGVAPQLRFHFGAALNVGVTQDQLVEVILLIQFLAGMPAAYNAIVELKAAISSAGEPPPYR